MYHAVSFHREFSRGFCKLIDPSEESIASLPPLNLIMAAKASSSLAGFDTLTLVGRSIFADCFFADRCGHAATVASSQA